jgi:type IV secretion system protein TrbL
MGGTGIIDQFLETFTRYIDSGFGLLGGDVGYLATTLAAIDLTLAGLFWSWGTDEDIAARLVKKTLFVGVFAYLIGNWNNLARIVFESFAGLGLKASGTGLSTAEFLRPGRIAQVGLDAGKPILEAISQLMGYVSFFENFVQITILLLAWIIVLLAFFILAIQLFVTLIEFKLTTLAGFVLIPFGLFGKTAFAAERVLGNVISSGVKVLVLAVIVGIGSTLFAQFTAGFAGNQPTLENVLALMLGALALLGLGIFGPGIANGIVSGGPQLGAGSAVGTGLAAGGALAAGAGVAAGAAGLTGRMAAGAAARTASVAGAVRTGANSGASAAGGNPSPLRAAAAHLSGGSGTDTRRCSLFRWRTRLGSAHEANSLPRRLSRHPLHPRQRFRRRRSIRRSQAGRLTLLPPVTKRSFLMFKRSAVHYGRTPEPVTPYQRAAQVWDDRIGAARVQAKNWRLMAFGCLLLSGGLSGALVWQATHGTITPWIVEIDRFGEARTVAAANPAYEPSDPQIAFHLARFVEHVRGLPMDAIVLRQDWLRAYDFATDRGAAALNDFARNNNPFDKLGKVQIAIEVSSVIRASSQSFRVAWTERRYEQGQIAATERWSAVLTIMVEAPRDLDRLRKNPLGIYVNAINWSKEFAS